MNPLSEQYGPTLTPQQLADYLQVDTRTIRKYADRWGGVQVCPGVYRFPLKIVQEVVERAVINSETWEEKMERQHNGQGNNQAKVISRQQQGIRKGGRNVGSGNKKGTAKIPNSFGLF